MTGFASDADARAIEAEMPWSGRDVPRTIHQALARAAAEHGARPALSFQLLSGPGEAAVTLSWAGMHARVTQLANLFRALGVGRQDAVALVLPNSAETAVALLAGMVAGIVSPINPLLEPAQIASILRETGAGVVVTLRSFPRTDIAQKVAQALRDAPGVHTVVELDLGGYLAGLRRLVLPLIRPRQRPRHRARVIALAGAARGQRADRLTFDDPPEDRVAAYFHTGGTTGMPKVAQHRVSGMVYNGWLGASLLFRPDDVVMCPLPLFHVFATYPIMMSMVVSGGHLVLPTPAGYRGDGVFDNFWKLIERYRCSYLVTVPSALAALMQRPVDADISSLKSGFSGSAPLPVELYRRFQRETGVEIVEGYGLTECTCLVSVNPPAGEKKIGSVGVPLPYTRVRILNHDGRGGFSDAGPGRSGEICISSPGVFSGRTYTEADKNRDLFVEGRFLRTGDLGRIDADGYLWITGRAKDLIIRGGHNIDPAVIEEALSAHPSVALAAAIGQPDLHSGELPAAYVELVRGARASVDELLAFCRERIPERAAVPKYLEILPELPRTAVGKLFKPALRAMAIRRVLQEALDAEGLPARVGAVVDDPARGQVAQIEGRGRADDARVAVALGGFALPWEWRGTDGEARG